MIEKKVMLKALKTPYKPLLDSALKLVALNDKQLVCIKMCVIDGLTEDEVADKLDRSRDFVSRHKREAIKRCCYALSNEITLLNRMIDYK